MAVSDPPQAVAVRASCRADLAGGTLDIWPLGLLHAGACTVNVALDLGVDVEIELGGRDYRVTQASTEVSAASVEELAADPETALIGLVAGHFSLPPFALTIRSDSPRGGGLGASSALVVALIAAAEKLTGRRGASAAEVSALARDFEAQLMQLPTGRQDHFPALLGGALKIEQRAGGERVLRLKTDLDELGESLIVAYSGQSHFSAGNNWEIIRRRLDGDPGTVQRFEGIARTAEALAEALERGDLRTVGSLMNEEWGYRRGLAPSISTDSIETLLRASLGAGAWGGKVCGAGGGGCLTLLAPSSSRDQVESELRRHGAQVLRAHPSSQPLCLTVL